MGAIQSLAMMPHPAWQQLSHRPCLMLMNANVTNLAQGSTFSQLVKFLLSSPLDHSPFLALSNSLIVDQGTVKDTSRHSTLCDKVFSTAKTRTALKPTDHPT